LVENGQGFNIKLKSLAWVKQDVSEVNFVQRDFIHFQLKSQNLSLDPTVMISG
jgi:hypothetical protein